MRAAVLAVGSELLSTDRLDTHSLRLAGLFERYGARLVGKAVAGDVEVEIAAALRTLLERADLVVATGGLGPTADDVTREACATLLGRRLVEDSELWSAIERRFASLGRTPSANNRRQAMVPEGAAVLANEQGTAPGLRLDLEGGRTLFLLQGVAHELEAALERHLEPWLAARSTGTGRERRTLRVALQPESEVDRALAPAYVEFGREQIVVLASPGEVRVQMLADGEPESRRQRLDGMARRLRELLGVAVFGEGEQLTLEGVVGELLAGRGATVATAESCTGGLLAERLTRVPGSSRYFPGGVVTYADAQKTALLGVESELLARHGAVSEPTARAMAAGARERFATDFALGVTGVAGPGGGSAAKPVGLVHVALAHAQGTLHRAVRLPGSRERIRWQATQVALELLRRRLLEAGAAA